MHHSADVSAITTQPYFTPAPTLALDTDESAPHMKPHTQHVDVHGRTPPGGQNTNYTSPRMLQLQHQQSFDYDCKLVLGSDFCTLFLSMDVHVDVFSLMQT